MLGKTSLQHSNRIQFLYIFLFNLAVNYTKYRTLISNSFPSGEVRIPLFGNTFTNAGQYVSTAVSVIIAAILAMIATLIGVQLIGPVATAVGGALNNKNLTGAANSITAQLTLLFVVVILLIPIVFIAVFGKIAEHESA
jgi:hypothetical protein